MCSGCGTTADQTELEFEPPPDSSRSYIVMAYIVMAYIVMIYIVMAYVVMIYIVMAYIVMIHIVMAQTDLEFESALDSSRFAVRPYVLGSQQTLPKVSSCRDMIGEYIGCVPICSTSSAGINSTTSSSISTNEYLGHNYTGHNYIAHDYTGHNYTGHDYTGHTYIGQD